MRPPSCCSVEVMKGGLGELRYPFFSSDRTVKGRPSSPAASARAVASSRRRASEERAPCSSKSLPLATRRPPTAVSVDWKAGAVGWRAVTFQ